jgi:putative transposase
MSERRPFVIIKYRKMPAIRISMDGRGRWLDNVFIERLWCSLKYENVYLNAYETGSEAKAGIGKWIDFYNIIRPHSALEGKTPWGWYHEGLLKAA